MCKIYHSLRKKANLYTQVYKHFTATSQPHNEWMIRKDDWQQADEIANICGFPCHFDNASATPNSVKLLSHHDGLAEQKYRYYITPLIALT